MLQKFSLDKINVTKYALCFLARGGPAYQSFAFNSQILYKLKHKVRLSKTLCGTFIFDSVLFLLSYNFVPEKAQTL